MSNNSGKVEYIWRNQPIEKHENVKNYFDEIFHDMTNASDVMLIENDWIVK